MMLELDKIIELKRIIKEKYNTHLHMHDACGGQYFSFDENIDGIEDFVNSYLTKLNQKAEFSTDGLTFSVK